MTKRERRFLKVFTNVSVLFFIALTVASQLYVFATDNMVNVPSGLSFVKTGNFQTHYETWGKKSSTQVVLIHGAFESTYYFKPLAAALSKKYHVEAYDIKGFGYTQRVAPYSVAADAQQLFDFLKARKIKHPILVGHSLGAGVVARFVLDHPKVAAGYVFLDGDGLSTNRAGANFFTHLPDPYITAAYRFVTSTDVIVPAVFKYTCGPTCSPLTQDQLSNIKAPFLVPNAQSALFQLAESPIAGVEMPDLLKLQKISIPREVIFGADDQEFAPETPAQIAGFIGAPAPVLITGAGHISMWAQPERVAQALFGFIGSV
jgi:pimeloyl-ACP methyl ester carboxylesterase